MVQLMEAIAGGARTFLRREYRWVAGFVIIMIVLLVTLLDWGPMGAVAYFLGALLSAAAGWIGMTVATMANARTTQAARTGPQKALPLAFRGGAVMGFSVAGLSLLGLSFCYLLFVVWLKHLDAFQVLTAYGLGASSIALFSRVGGGIYTKAADVGADLVGKVEAGIPEDDPRNPATIADNVGDNVGDVAGMGADLFESYAGAIIAPVAYVWFAYGATSVGDAGEGLLGDLLLFPFLVAFVGMAASIIGAFFVRAGASSRVKDLAKALHRGTNAAMVVTLGGVFAIGAVLFEGSASWGLPLAVVCGIAVGYAIGQVAEIWTSDHYRPVRNIAKPGQDRSGHHDPVGTVGGHDLRGRFGGSDRGSGGTGLLGRRRHPGGRGGRALRRHLRRGDRGHRHARHHGRRRGSGCLRPDRRQRRRHRRDVGTAVGGARGHRLAGTRWGTPPQRSPRGSRLARPRSPRWPSSPPSNRPSARRAPSCSLT